MGRILRQLGVARRTAGGASRPKITGVVADDRFLCSHFFDRARTARGFGSEIVVMPREGNYGDNARAAPRLLPVKFTPTGINPTGDSALPLRPCQVCSANGRIGSTVSPRPLQPPARASAGVPMKNRVWRAHGSWR